LLAGELLSLPEYFSLQVADRLVQDCQGLADGGRPLPMQLLPHVLVIFDPVAGNQPSPVLLRLTAASHSATVLMLILYLRLYHRASYIPGGFVGAAVGPCWDRVGTVLGC